MTSQQAADIAFLALAVYREARGESYIAQLAVAYSIMERVKNPGWWGSTVMGVIFRPHQYSSMTQQGDPQLRVWPTDPNEGAWRNCLSAANAAYEGTAVANPCPEVTSYYDVSISPPNWATDDLFVKQIGRLKFYRVAV